MPKLQYNPSTIATPKTGNPIGTYHLANNPELYEIQRTNNFELIIPASVNQMLKAGYSQSDANNTVSNADEVLRIAVSSAFVPHFQQSVISVKRGNNEIKFAGVPTFQAGQITFIDYIGAEVAEALMAWQNQSYNALTEKVGLVEDYKRQCYLVAYSPDGQVVRDWVLHGCWISNLSEDNFDNESNNKKKLTVTLEYDKAYPGNYR